MNQFTEREFSLRSMNSWQNNLSEITQYEDEEPARTQTNSQTISNLTYVKLLIVFEFVCVLAGSLSSYSVISWSNV